MKVIILLTFLLAPVEDTAFRSALKENEHSQQRKCDSLDRTANIEQTFSEVFCTWVEPENKIRKFLITCFKWIRHCFFLGYYFLYISSCCSPVNI